MKQSMKKSTLKKVVVKCGQFWEDVITVDSSLFDDVYMEAATRAMEKRKLEPDLKVTVMMICWLKKDEKNINKHFSYNTYFILINSGLHAKAELMRAAFFNQYKIDLRFEKLKEDDAGGSANSVTDNTPND
jgi:hypothetical protein